MAEIKDFNRVMRAVNNFPIHTTDEYLLIDTPEERFSEMMKLYSTMCSFEGLMTSYQNLEEQKDKNIRSPLWVENIQEYIDGVLEEREEYHDATVHSLSIFASNKIKGECEKTINDMFDYFLGIRKVDKDTYMKRNGEIIDEGTRGRLYSRLTRYVAPSSDKDVNSNNSLLDKIKKDGLTEVEAEYVKSKCGKAVKTLVTLKRCMMYIKDYEIDKTLPLLEQDGISYGLAETDARGNSKQKQPLLIIDLPYYGQFSVHLKGEQSKSEMSQKNIEKLRICNSPYEFQLYEDRTVLLSDIPSKEAEEIDSLENKRLTQIVQSRYEPDKRFAHYAALKLGATRKDLYRIYGMKFQEIGIGEEDKSDEKNPSNEENDSGDGRE